MLQNPWKNVHPAVSIGLLVLIGYLVCSFFSALSILLLMLAIWVSVGLILAGLAALAEHTEGNAKLEKISVEAYK